MNFRRAAPLLFVALCLGLSALVLRRQIAAHPVPRTDALRRPADPNEPPDSSRPADLKTWHVAAGAARHEVVATIGDQLDAIRTGNADRAWFYQSQGLHRNFHSSAQVFVQSIARGYPEFGHPQSVAFGPVLMDATGGRAQVTVTVRGQNGRLARGYYRLIREEGGYKVAAVLGGQALR